jgi:hypothetical protein
MRFTTFISGYNTAEQPVDDGAPALSELTPEQQLERVERVEQFSELHFVQVRGAGVWKPESIRRLAERRGIVRGLRAEAVSFDTSGKGRHVRREIAL